MPPQLLIACRVRDQLPAQLCRRRPQKGGQLPILPAHRRPALPDAAVVLPAVEQGGELLVHRLHKGGEVEAAVGEVAGVVAGHSPPPLQHGGRGVVEGVEGGHIVPLPAAGPEGAGPAHPTGRPVKDRRHIVVVLRHPEGAPQGLVQGTEGGGGGLQLFLHIALGPAIRGRRRGWGQQASQALPLALRHHEKSH